MFGNESPEVILELQENTTSRMILKLIVAASEQHLLSLRARRSDSRSYIQTYDAKRAAFFEAALCVEFECWKSTDFTKSYEEIIMSVTDGRTLQESISTLDGWIKKAKESGF